MSPKLHRSTTTGRRSAHNPARVAFDADPEPTFVIAVEPGPVFRVAGINRAAQRRFGLRVERVLGRRVEELNSSHTAARIVEQYRAVLESGIPATRALPTTRPGNAQVAQVRITPVVDESSDRRYLVSVIQDVAALRAAERLEVLAPPRFRALVEHSPDIVWVVDATGTVSYASPAATTNLGYRPGELLGREPVEFVHPDDHAILGAAMRAANGASRPSLRFRLQHRDGSWRHVEGVLTDLRGEPGVDGVLVNARDVTERLQVEEALRASEASFRAVAASAPIGISIADAQDQIVYTNEAFKRIFRAAFKGRPMANWLAVVHPDDRPRVESAGHAAREQGVPFDEQYRIVTPDADARWLRVRSSPIHDEDGNRTGYVGTAEDVTTHKELEARLAFQGTHDTLTGLPTRAVLQDQLAQALARVRGSGSRLAVLFVDLDHFKLVNDSLGHPVGDRVLTMAARRLEQQLRPTDMVARVGGDEFVVVCEGVADDEEAALVAERLAALLAAPYEVEGSEIACSASIGVACSGTRRTDAEGLLVDADAAMYAAKYDGRARSRLFDRSLRAARRPDLDTVTALHHAIERHELRVHYQPIVDLHTGRVVRLEALVRWEHPERGLLPAGEFVPAAEETGLIEAIDDWVLETACAQLWRWNQGRPADDPLRLAVNLSARQLGSAGLAERVSQVLATARVAPHLVELEITESVLVDDTDAALVSLRALRQLDVRLAIDDFGTGYSSLTHLRRYPLDTLKIDRTFVRGVAHNTEDSTIVAAVIGMARGLGLDVTAEGVETARQAARLRALGCGYAQGYHFARPQPADDVSALGDVLDPPHDCPLGRRADSGLRRRCGTVPSAPPDCWYPSSLSEP